MRGDMAREEDEVFVAQFGEVQTRLACQAVPGGQAAEERVADQGFGDDFRRQPAPVHEAQVDLPALQRLGLLRAVHFAEHHLHVRVLPFEAGHGPGQAAVEHGVDEADAQLADVALGG